ncbi:DNA-directed RNA polymerase subunit alpha C-terminal domain-containing protein [Butyrivibrio sp. WCD2001]|uniref:DNA-directed RNA polymerase subunit alpha C-terminal domain-containing protein n=1 Tax=Butyrivibrio sp. WCD2001 TaxID=1280681 RepID=UPI00041E0D49|nr:DNA-directed RNA polymerase subunit alpha C-terminal domain-containing protein [Butyrivibrio sp. WCD2001]
MAKYRKTRKFRYPLNLLRDICKTWGAENLPVSATSDVRTNLLNVVNGLTDDEIELIRLRYEEEKTFVALSDYYGISPSGVRDRMVKILKLLGTKQYSDMIYKPRKDKSEIKTLEDLDLSNHAYRTLLRNNITTLDQLKEIGLEGIQGLRSVGASTYNEIQKKAGFLWR